MSNLYKQWLVRTEDTRVINSNDAVTELMSKNLRQSADARANGESSGEQSSDGTFKEGLFGENLKILELQEPEIDYAAEAKAEAERILEEARGRAEQILTDAQNGAAEIHETAKNQGYEEGRTAAARELEDERARLAQTYENRQKSLEEDYCRRRDSMEHDLVDVILEVFNKVFHIQFDNKKHILVHLIDDAILNVEGEKSFRIKVAPGNVQFLETHKEEILDHVGHDVELEILADSGLDGNGCMIETDSGVFDCGLGTQLENLIKDIRSLSCV